jgi:hypothetical protein
MSAAEFEAFPHTAPADGLAGLVRGPLVSRRRRRPPRRQGRSGGRKGESLQSPEEAARLLDAMVSAVLATGVEHALALTKFNSTFTKDGREREHRNEIVNHVRYCGGNSAGWNVCRARPIDRR